MMIHPDLVVLGLYMLYRALRLLGYTDSQEDRKGQMGDVSRDQQPVEKGSVTVTPPGTTHFSLPTKDLVLAVISTPPFNAENYVVINKTNPDVGFDKEQFERLTNE